MVLRHYYETAKKWFRGILDKDTKVSPLDESDEVPGFGDGTAYCQVCERQIPRIFLRKSSYNGQTYHKTHPIGKLPVGVYRENMG